MEYQGETLLLDDESILDQINVDEEADAEKEMAEYQTSLGENMLKVVSPDKLESLSMEEIEKLS